MPDEYYTHQFSGEEIDDAVVAARQLLENAVMKTPTLLTSADDINAWHGNGYYRWSSPSVPQNAPTLLRIDETGMYMYEFGYTEGFTQICGCAVASSPGLIRRQVFYGVPLQFGEWEWVDPPLQTGVEYRTTERAAGKPVYAKRVVYTPTAAVSNANLDITHGITDFSSLVRVEGSDSPYPIPRLESGGGFVGITYVNDTIIRIAVYNTTIAAGRTLAITLFYTKTTD